MYNNSKVKIGSQNGSRKIRKADRLGVVKERMKELYEGDQVQLHRANRKKNLEKFNPSISEVYPNRNAFNSVKFIEFSESHKIRNARIRVI